MEDVLRALQMDDYIPVFRQEKITYSDLPLLFLSGNEAQLERVVPHMGPRLRLQRFCQH